MKNKVFFLSILFFAIIYGTSCENDYSEHTTDLTVENLDGSWNAKDNDYDVVYLSFSSDHELFITQQHYSSSPSGMGYNYYLDTTSNIYLRPNIAVFDTLPYFVCPIKIVNADRIRIGNLPACLGEEGNQDITFVRH